MKSVSSNKELKQKVGIHAAGLVKDGMKVGIGTGSTVAFYRGLGRRIKEEGLKIQGTATSWLRVLCKVWYSTDRQYVVRPSDLAVDGADEIDPL